MSTTIVHLLRHGEVYNPQGILYGRLPKFTLSTLGTTMAETVAQRLKQKNHKIVYLAASPLVRAQQTAAPIAKIYKLETNTDERLIEAENHFEGLTFAVGDGALTKPKHWPYLINPFRPSWGEPYRKQTQRMLAAINTAAELAQGAEAILVSHQLPIWVARLSVEKKPLWHDPRKRQCSLASLTSFEFFEKTLLNVSYSEPVSDLLPPKTSVAGA